jgi:hypothetical protein
MTQAWSKQSILAACLDCSECGLYYSNLTYLIYRIYHKNQCVAVYDRKFMLVKSIQYHYDSYTTNSTFIRIPDLDTLLEKLKDYYGL